MERKTGPSLAVAAILVFGLVGCASQPPTSARSSASTGGSVATAKAAPVPAAAKASSLGAVVGSGTKVTDSRGTYETTKLAPEAIPFHPGSVDSSVTAHGYSVSDAQSAQKWATNFLATQGLDSTTLDGGKSAYNAWLAANADKYFDPKYKVRLSTAPKPGGYGVITDVTNQLPGLARDGQPRISKEDVQVTTLSAGEYDGKPYMYVGGTATVHYRVTDADGIKWMVERSPGKTVADAKKAFPVLNDGKMNDYAATVNWGYSTVKGGPTGWEMIGYTLGAKFQLVGVTKLG